jgi:4-hydroxy-2-oxoheptanedioate aldolase
VARVSHEHSASDQRPPHRYGLDRGELRRRLAAGEATYGTFVGAATPVTAEVCAAAGVDWVLLDLEHGAGGEEQARDVVPAAASYGVPTVVRVESAERIRAGRLLDVGAAGIMFPRIDSAAQARECVRHLRYPPEGDRGVATYNRMCGYGLDPAALDRSNSDVLGIVQIETLAALGAVAEIAALDGVDVLFVGPRDLSHALDVPGQTQAPAYLAALDRVVAAADAHGKVAGLLVPDGAAAARMTAAGWRFLAIGSDTTLLATAVATELRRASVTA